MNAAPPVRTVHRDLVFAELPGFRPLLLDLHLPDAARPPVMLFVHGGGWRVGTRATFCPAYEGEVGFEAMVAAGFAVASVDYRLSGEARFPAPRDDVATALEWVVANAESYGYDADRIVVWGESAGALLGMLVALEPGARVSGVIDWFGPANIVAKGADPGSREHELLGGTAVELPELAREASAAFQVHPDAPPFYVAHGIDDAFVPIAQSEELVAALDAAGVSVQFERVPGANHLWKGEGIDLNGLLDRALGFARSVV